MMNSLLVLYLATAARSSVKAWQRPALTQALYHVSRCGSNTACSACGLQVWNPSFDVTPASLLTGIITEHGVISRRGDAFPVKEFLQAEVQR